MWDLWIRSFAKPILLKDKNRIHYHVYFYTIYYLQNLNIKSLQPERGILTFAQLKPRLMNLLIYALQVESDSLNSQMLLGN